MDKIKVLIVDDSAVVRKVLSAIIENDPGLELLNSAADPIFAMEKMKKSWPDVIVLDVEMPRMDGITFLKKIMTERPTPVVMCSTLTEKGAQTTMQAMSAGAVDIINKPKVGLKNFLEESSAVFGNVIRAAAAAKVTKLKRPANPSKVPEKLTADAVLSPTQSRAMSKTTEQIIAIGTSTGGTNALEYLLTALPKTSPGIVVVQHMPEKFTEAFATRLNNVCQLEVKEAQNKDNVIPGRALIAPGGQHMVLKRSGARYYVEVVDGPLVSRHRPSVDVLFRSVANTAGKNALGIIMTGMGDDGASGLLEMHNAGAYTLGQNEESCVVYGMPKEAFKRGAVDKEVALEALPKEIFKFGTNNE